MYSIVPCWNSPLASLFRMPCRTRSPRNTQFPILRCSYVMFMQPLPGFRDFLPDDCAVRNLIFARWREVARRYAFVEWDGPPLEATELYRKKSGTEIVDQLFNFTDKGEREVAMRPELTPTLARVVAAHEREFKKPLKWFSIGQFFRYEKQQRGRLREHFQLNCDIVGECDLAADIELAALCIDVLRAFGLTENDFVVRISDGAVSLPALGFAMGDVVLGELINEIPRTRAAMQKAITSRSKIDIYIVIAKEERRGDALTQIQQLRDRGYRVDYPLTPTKVARQFQAAEDAGAALALLYGDEWPQVKVKNLPTREESLIDHGALLDSVAKFFTVGSSS